MPVDPRDPKYMKQVHVLQDAVKVSEKSPGSFEIPKWDRANQKN